MNRRSFLSGGAAAAAFGASAAPGQSNAAKFKLKYGPHPGMFKNSAGEDLLDQIRFSADQGFTAWEDNGAGDRPVDLQNKIGETLDQLGMTMGVFVSFGDFDDNDFVTRTDKEYQDEIRKKMHDRGGDGQAGQCGLDHGGSKFRQSKACRRLPAG